MTGGLVGGEESERFGRLVRHFKMSVSAGTLALAWARQENAPNGATVVVDREVSPLGRLGQIWTTPPERTLACAVVLRPPLPAEQADVTWLVAALAAAEGAEAATGTALATWWPDAVVEPESRTPAAVIKAEVQLGPGQVRSAVVTVRFDLEVLGVDADRRDDVLEAFLRSIDEIGGRLSEGAAGPVAAYERRCGLIGHRVKVRLLPKGETRGIARRVDRMARLELESGTGMVERIAIDALRALEVV
jgi:BirA family biotin operon repressor/biotin-[acetyl-CoA-carboxylase] ligase